MSKVELLLSEDARTVTLKASFAQGQPLPKVDKFKKEFENSLYRTFVLDEQGLSSSFESFKQSISSDQKQGISEFSCVIANAADAVMEITFEKEDMLASITLTCAQGGKDITMKTLAKFLIDNGLKKGIQKDAMVTLVEHAKSNQKTETITIEVAKGCAAVAGDNGYIDFLVPDPVERVLKPKKLEAGKVDMRELGQLCYVKKGTKLAQLVPPTQGINGFTVKGDELSSEPGAVAVLEESEGCIFLDEEQSIIVADMDGMPKHHEKSVSVSQVFNIENVDVSTGNIEFDGSVLVQGNVCEAMKVIASGDVIVAGLVESAYIDAGGDICIAQSVIGHQKEDEYDGFGNSTTLIAGGNINASFIQYANVRAKGDIRVTQYIAQSQVTLRGHLWIGKESKADGKLFGCYVQAGKSVQVGTLGSPSSATVTLDFNHLLDALAEVRQKIEDKTQTTIEKTKQISELIEQIENKEIERADMLNQLTLALKKYLPLLGKLNRLNYEQQSYHDLHLNEIEVIATFAILSGAEVAISAGTFSFKREYGPSRLNYFEHKVILEPLTQSSEPANN